MKPKTGSITQKVVIPATPEEVYEALVDAKIHSAFTGAKATGDAKVGAEFTAWDGYISGKHLELEPGKRIVQEWITSEWPEGYGPSRLEFTFCKVKDGTELTMVHSNIPADQADEYKQGWIDNYWDLMKEYFQKKKRSK